ncbi:MAG: hypothetical protein KC548_06420, partial [Nanoarchaeota archaeon]|nr:hypothetical protein [Nanoarchaeota archaeon]
MKVVGRTRTLGNLLLCLLLLFSFSYAACKAKPDSISVSSGSNNLGTFSSGETAYIDADLASSPLEVMLTFENVEESCYDAANLKMRLFSSASGRAASLSSEGNETGVVVASFTFADSIQLTTGFTSYIDIETNDGQTQTITLNFDYDNTAPTVSISSSPSQSVVGPSTPITITYAASDSQSGLVSISGLDSQTFENPVASFTNSTTETLSSTQTFTVTATDAKGLSSTASLEIKVDSEAPTIISFENVGYSSGTQRTASYELVVEDASFADSPPTVTADFSALSSGVSSLSGSCTKEGETRYSCKWQNVPITLSETSTVTIPVTVTDSLGNEVSTELSEEVFIDNEGPVISSFELVNRLGVTNIFSPYDDESIVRLVYSDESTLANVKLYTDFGKITLLSPSCEFESGTATCEWKLKDAVAVYKGIGTGSDTFSVQVVDEFGNPSTAEINVSIDEYMPQILSVEMIETESIKDGIVKSGEILDFKLFVEDDNLDDAGQYFVYADASSIYYAEGSSNLSASCSQYNETAVQCDISGIEVVNGYKNESIKFYVNDRAGNRNKEELYVEIFKISDEVFSSFKISDMDILNPINRNLILESDITGWFEGKIEKVGTEKNITIVNYQLKDCNDSDINPILMGERTLYPDDVVINEGQENLEDFVMKTLIETHPNVNDLNTKTMHCTMSILKRNEKEVFPPELVDFTLNIHFYDMLRTSLLDAHANKLLAEIESIESLGSWLDGMYDIYKIFRGACELISKVREMLKTFSHGVDVVQGLLASVGSSSVASPLQKLANNMNGLTDNFLFDKNGFIGKACDWVSCSNGATLTEYFNVSGLSQTFEGIKKLEGIQDAFTQAV